MICENCGKEHDGTFGSGRFCCKSCAISYSNKQRGSRSNKTKEKIRLSLIEYNKSPNKVKGSGYKCKYCGKIFHKSDIRDTNGLKYCSAECKHKFLSENTGGYRHGAGHGKSGWYKGIHCDSSWELAFLIYYLENGLYIERCKERRKYIIDNKEHTYIPDFITDEGIIEIKGYETKESKIKSLQNPDIKLMFGKDLKYVFDYVHKKYGYEFTYLYEK